MPPTLPKQDFRASFSMGLGQLSGWLPTLGDRMARFKDNVQKVKAFHARYKVKRLSTKEAADYIGFSQHTLRNWRKGRKRWTIGLYGPKFGSIHGRIFYTPSDLDAWMELFRTDRHDIPPVTTLDYFSELA